MKALLVLGLVTLVQCIYDCEFFKGQCSDSCRSTESSFSCQSNASPGSLTGFVVIVEESRQRERGGSHSCSCQNVSLESCSDYTSFCETECGSFDQIEFFTCDLERLPNDGSLFSAQSRLNMECVCVGGATGDLPQPQQAAPSTSQEDEAVNLLSISYNATYDPAKASPSTDQIVSAIMQQQQKKSTCFDYLPVSEGTCEDRIAWGSCAESWISEKFYCAKSCGLCDEPLSAQYDCFAQYTSCSQACDGLFEFACYRALKKTDCVCTQQGSMSMVSQQKEAQIDASGVNVFSGVGCSDFLPANEGTCASRLQWNSCQESWMKEKNYCAKSCGFCQPQATAPAIVDTQEQEKDEDEWVMAHNQFRHKHCVEDVSWSVSLALEAQKLVDQCGMVDNYDIASNFFTSITRNHLSTPLQIVSSWYEIGIQNGLNFDAPVFTKQIAPTSKVIWKSSTEIGCAQKTCGKNLYAYCMYNPPSNILDKFETQVTPVCQ